MSVYPLRYSRRDLVEMAFGSAAGGLFAAAVGCDQLSRLVSDSLPPAGELLSQDRSTGHRVRDLSELPPPKRSPSERHHCVIIGAGVAGLSAAWHAAQRGIDDVVVLELETEAGGTSRSGEVGGFRFPWGAHYLPVPKAENKPLVEFLKQCGVLTVTSEGIIEAAEQYLCRDPEERVFARNQWWGGLYPDAVATPDDHVELDRFRQVIKRLAVESGDDGRRMFALPTRESSSGDEAHQLDRITMTQWMRDHGFTSTPLMWLVDYACRDDYGLRANQTSAWAGLFYFAARLDVDSGETQEVMTWSAGNGFLIGKLSEPLGDRLRLGQAVIRVTPKDTHALRTPLLIDVLDRATGNLSTIEAEHVIVAVPQFIASRMLDAAWLETHGVRRNTPRSVFSYGSWIVANVHLSQRPHESEFPMSWDNVIMSSGSLGYVNATHQLGMDYGPTVLTWYHALADDQPAEVRERLMTRTWAEVAETVIMDMELAHPDIRPLITRLDAMVWGHAMPQPRVGSIFHPARAAARKAIGNIHFACTDLSGIALFEEAFDHGRRAALECG